MPWMITPTQDVGKPDPLIELLRQKYEWNRKWTMFKTSYGKLLLINIILNSYFTMSAAVDC